MGTSIPPISDEWGILADKRYNRPSRLGVGLFVLAAFQSRRLLLPAGAKPNHPAGLGRRGHLSTKE